MSETTNNFIDMPEKDAPNDARWRSRAVLALLVILIIRLAWTLLAVVDLAADEAYYWDWSRHLDWCYYSKPPMVAWLIAASTRLLGSTTAMVRLPATILSFLTTVIIYLFARRAFSAKTGFWSIVAFTVAPGVFLSGWFMTIDPPLLFFWAAALYCAWRAMYDSSSLGWWCLTGIATAGGILSKQMMLVFPLLVFLYLIITPECRKKCVQPGFYLFLFISLSSLIPLLYWNAHNEWITFQHTSEHFRGNDKHPLEFIATFFYFIGTQMLVLSPLMWAMAIVTGAIILRYFRRYNGAIRWLAFTSLVPLIVIALMSLRQRILPNWPAVFYIATAVYTPAWACGKFSTLPSIDRFRFLFKPALLIGAVMTIAVCIFLPVSVYVSVGGNSLNDGKLDDWKYIAKRVEAFRTRVPQPAHTFVAATHRHIVAPMAFYLKNQPHAFDWPMDIIFDAQYSLWRPDEPPFDQRGKDMFLLHDEHKPLPAELTRPKLRARYVDSFTRIGAVTNITGTRIFGIYVGRNSKDWPDQSPHLK